MIVNRRRFLTTLGATSLAGCTTRDPPAPPRVTGPPRVQLPPVLSETTAGGSRALVVEDHGVPLVSMAIVTGGGHAYEALEDKGLASLSAALLLEGMDGGDQVAQLERYGELGTTPESVVSARRTVLYCTVHRDDAPAALRLLADTLHRATVAEETFERLRRKQRDTLDYLRGAPDHIAGLGVLQGTLGVQHPVSTMSVGTAPALASLSVAKVRDWYAQRFRLDDTTFALSGDLRIEDARSWIDAAVQQWPSATGERPENPIVSTPPPPNAPPNVLIPWPGVPQGIMAYGGFHAPRFHPDEPAQTVARSLVGSFMHHELRTALRTSYGLQDREYDTTHGSIRLHWAKLENDSVGTAVERLRERLGKLQAELSISDEAVDATRFSMMVGMMNDFHGSEAALVQLLELADVDGTPDAFTQRLDGLRGLDAEIVTFTLRQLFDPETLALSVVAVPDGIETVRSNLPSGSVVDRSPPELLGVPG